MDEFQIRQCGSNRRQCNPRRRRRSRNDIVAVSTTTVAISLIAVGVLQQRPLLQTQSTKVSAFPIQLSTSRLRSSHQDDLCHVSLRPPQQAHSCRRRLYDPTTKRRLLLPQQQQPITVLRLHSTMMDCIPNILDYTHWTNIFTQLAAPPHHDLPTLVTSSIDIRSTTTSIGNFLPFSELGRELSQSLDIGSNLSRNVGNLPETTTGLVLESLGYDVLVFLAASVLVTPICQGIFHITPILGYLIIGAILGPHGFDVFANSKADIELGDFGILFLLFSEGLEVTRPRLRKLANFLPLGYVVARQFSFVLSQKRLFANFYHHLL
jgi:Sodium/hydrogen exchanger family